MGRGVRVVVAVVVAFVVFRIGVAVMPSDAGGLVSLVLGVAAGAGAFVLTARWARQKP